MLEIQKAILDKEHADTKRGQRKWKWQDDRGNRNKARSFKGRKGPITEIEEMEAELGGDRLKRSERKDRSRGNTNNAQTQSREP